MNIYLIRHGQSIGNLNKVYLGHTDLDLSEIGYKQAERVCDYVVKNYNIDKIFSSDLIRAYNTVLPASQKLNIPIIKEPELREIYAGLWENKKYECLMEKYADTYNTWLTDIGNAKCDGGETVVQLQKRIMSALTKIAINNPGNDILIGSHATPIRTIACTILGKDINELNTVEWPLNASITHVKYENNKFELVNYSNVSFLEEFITQPSSKM